MMGSQLMLAGFMAFALAQAKPTPHAKHGKDSKEAKESTPQVKVKYEEVLYDKRMHKAVFTGKPLVEVTRGDAVLVCKKLVAENDEQDQIRTAVCTGDVKLTRGARQVTCEQGTFDNETGRVTCEGNPIYRDGKSVANGKRLVYDLNTDNVTMTGQGQATVVQPLPGLQTMKEKSP
jgi:lipopolysaccharide transport protein LptA